MPALEESWGRRTKCQSHSKEKNDATDEFRDDLEENSGLLDPISREDPWTLKQECFSSLLRGSSWLHVASTSPMGWHWGTWGRQGDKEHTSNHLNHFTTTSPKEEPAWTKWWQKGIPKERSQRSGYLQPVLPSLCSLLAYSGLPTFKEPAESEWEAGTEAPSSILDPSLSHSAFPWTLGPHHRQGAQSS